MFVEVTVGPTTTGVDGAGDPVIWYPVRALLPVTAGAVQLTVAVCETLAKAALTFCGADGTPGVVEGTIALVVAPSPVPTPLVAVTVKVYVCVLTSPLTTAAKVEPPTVAVADPGFALTLYDVIASPPSLAGAVQVTVAEAFPGAALAVTGAPGSVAGVTALESPPGPCAPFPAATVKT